MNIKKYLRSKKKMYVTCYFMSQSKYYFSSWIPEISTDYIRKQSMSTINANRIVFWVSQKNVFKRFKSSLLTLSDSNQIKLLNVFFFSIASLNDSFAHCFKCIQLQQETQAIDGVVAFMDLLQTPHTYTHFEDILTRLSHTHIPILQTF